MKTKYFVEFFQFGDWCRIKTGFENLIDAKNKLERSKFLHTDGRHFRIVEVSFLQKEDIKYYD